MGKIITGPISTLDKKFSSFTRNTITRGKPNEIYVISQLQKFQKSYSQNGFFKDFLLRLEDFALGMEDNNFLDLAGIVFSKLAKMPTTPELKEQFLRGGLRVAKKQRDPIHTLARIVDLKKLFEQEEAPSKRYRMLFQEEKALETIIEDFAGAQSGHKTVSKKYSPVQKYKLQLARCKVDIAKRLAPQEAFPRLAAARDIFAELGRDNELGFVEKLILKLS